MSKAAVIRILIVIATQFGQIGGAPVTAATPSAQAHVSANGGELVSVAGGSRLDTSLADAARVAVPLAPSATITLGLCAAPSGACVTPAPVVISAMINVTETSGTVWVRAIGASGSLTVTEMTSSDSRVSGLLINNLSYAGKQDLPFELSTSGLLRLHPVFVPTSGETVTATLTYTADNGTAASVTVIGRPIVPPVFSLAGSAISQTLGGPITMTLAHALTLTHAGPITATTLTNTLAVVPDFDPAIARGRVGVLHVDSDAQAADLRAGLLGTGRLLSVTAINTYSETWTAAQLAEAFDVLLVDGVPTETAAYWGDQLYDFMAQGGLSIVAMGRAMGDRAPAGALWGEIAVRTSTGFMSSWGAPMALNLNAASTWNTHPILRDIASFRLPAWALPRGGGTYAPDTVWWAYATQDLDGFYPYVSVSLITERTIDLGGYRRRRVDLDFQPILSGCTPDCGFDPSSDGLRLIANTLRYVMQPEVATASLVSAVLAPGAGREISVTLNAAHALHGENRAAVLVHHNDPAAPDGRLEVLLNANRPADLQLAPDPPSFGNRYISGTYTLTLNLINSGGEAMIVHTITSTDPALAVTGTPGEVILPPYSAQPTFQLTWTPVTTGGLNAGLLITTSFGTAVYTVTGTAFDLSDAIAPQLNASNHVFPNTLIGTRGGREVYVYHEDPGHLLITGLRTSDPRFTMTGELGLPFDLPEDYTYNWYKIALGFHPDAAGTVTATGYITTSAGVLTLNLSGTGVAPAPYAISTPSISATMFATQTSIARQFQITNTGTQTIQVSASVYPSFDAGVAKGNVAFIHMLSATQAAAIAAVLTGTGLLQSVTSINILTDLPTLGQLIQYDAALVGGVDGPYAASLGSRLVDYVDQGGGLVLIGGALRNDQCLPGNLNVWNPACASWVSNITETLSIGYSDLLHPAMRGVSTFVRPRDGKSALTSGSVFGDVAYTDYPYLLVEMGSGLPTLGEDFPRLDLNFDPVFTECEGACGWDPATDGARLMANALRLTMGRQILRSGPSVAIGPGKTATPTITLYGQVVSGTNYADIRLLVDGHYRQTLPVTLNVQGPPSFFQSGASVAFGNVYVGQSVTNTPYFENRGASPIDIYTVTLSMPHVRLEQYCFGNVLCDTSPPSLLRPWSRRPFSLIFQPTASGAFTGTATFSTSVGLKTISLSGASAHDIEVRAAPASVYLTTTWNAVHEIPYTLTNLSAVTAQYTLTESSPNITLAGPLTSTLAAGEVRSNAFTATLNTVNILPGAYISNILVGQSDLFNAAERSGDAYPISVYIVDRYLAVTPPSFVYPNAVLGVPLTRTFSLTNQGNVTLSVTGFGIDNADWTPLIGLPITLAPAGRISVPLVFVPSTLGALATTLVMTSDAPQARSIGLTATVVLTPQIAVTPVAIDETVLDDEQRPIAITLTNAGQGNLDFSAAAAGGTLFVLSGASGVVPAGQSARMTATIMGNLMTVGVQYHWPITITSNDPAATKVVIPVTATDGGLPLPVSLFGPANGAANISVDGAFTWTKPSAATGARFRHWPADATPPASAQFTSTAASGSHNPFGFLRESQPYLWQMETYNAYGATLGPVWSFTTEQRIDLQAMSLSAPDFAWSNGQIGVNWVISNAGHLTATGTWVDKVYLSTLPTFDGSATLLGQRNNVSALAPGQAYASSGTYTVPTGTEGLRYVHVKTDANGAFVASREYTNNNTIAGTVMTVSLTPPPDLQVTSISAPSDAFSQQTIQVNYVVSNTSAVTIPTTAWVDRVYLSLDDALGVDDTLKATINQNRSLAPGASYTGSAAIALPQGISGTRYIIVWTDALSAIFEHSGDNNNTRASNAINVILRPPPDLQVTSVVVPGATGSGQIYTVVYTVSNLGPGDTDVSAWDDRIYRNQNPNPNVGPALLATIGHAGILPAGQSYVITRAFSMPHGVTGDYYVHVSTDYYDEVYEYTSEGNNWGSGGPISVTLTPPPDLQVTGVSAPAFGVAGSNSDVVFTVTNLGPGSTAAGAWVDSLYRNEDPDHAVAPVTLGTFNHAGALAPGESYTMAASITWPAGVETAYYLHVRTDLNDDVYEHSNEGNNWGASGAISISLGLTPDLLAERIALLSAASVMRGRSISATWTVANIGEAATTGSWNDRIQLRRLSNSVLYTLGTYARPAGLSIGERYTRTLTIKIPSSVPADDYELRVVTDIANAVVENGREANNTAIATATLAVLNALSGETDLVIDQPEAAGAFGSGQPLTLTWRVTNELNTVGPLWRDRVLLRDCSLVCADTLLKDITQTGALAEGQGYAGSAVATLPNGISGTFSLVFETDWLNQVNDIDPLNNAISLPITVTLSPWANLRPAEAPAPGPGLGDDQWYRGFSRVVTWSVENAGVAMAGAVWTDRLYLSVDTTLDAGDLVLSTRNRPAGLAAGDRYTLSASIQLPIALAPGRYYLLLRTDVTDTVYERTDEGDNTTIGARVTVAQAPPADLTVSGVVFTPTGGLPGDALTAQWTLSNAGILTASASSLCNLLYLSDDAVWDVGDALIGESCAALNLAMGSVTTRTLTQPIPSVAPGSYRLIARTDTRFAITETNEGNNAAISAASLTIDIPELTLGISRTGQMSAGNVLDFRVTAPAGAALEITLNSASALGSNELYARLGAPATRALHDYTYGSPGTPDQRILVPDTQAGSYFIRAHVGPGHANTEYAILARLVPFGIDSVAPNRVGNAGPSTLDVRGSLFTSSTQLALISPSGAAITSSASLFADAGRIFATFSLSGAQVGLYDLRAVKGVETATMTGAVTVITGTGGRLEASLDAPANVRYHEPGSPARAYSTLYIRYKNVGDSDLSAPVFWLESPQGALLGLGDISDVKRQTVHAIGLSVEGHPGVLRPGETGQVPVLFSAQRPTTTFTFDMWYATNLDARPLGWPGFANEVQPVGVSDDDWAAVLPAVRTLLGETWGSYDQALAAQAETMVAQGTRTSNAREILRQIYLHAAGLPRQFLQGIATDAQTGAPLAGETVLAALLAPGNPLTDAIMSISEAKVDALGHFTAELFSSGLYSVAVRGLDMDVPVSVTVPVSASVQGVVLSATQGVPFPSRGSGPPDMMMESPQLLVVEGKPHLVFVSQGYVYHTWDAGSGWREAVPVGQGGAPRLVYAPNLLNGSEAGLALFWREGITNSARIMNAAARWQAGDWQWSDPIVYFEGPVGSGSPNVALDDGGAPILTWLMKDWTNPADDTDIYYARAPMTAPEMLGKIVGQARLTEPFEGEHGRIPEGTLVNLYTDGSARPVPAGPERPDLRVHYAWDFTYDQDGWLPVPVIGGNNEVSATGTLDALLDDDEMNLQGTAQTGAELLGGRASGYAGVSVRAHWRLDKNTCKYNFDYAQLSGHLGASGRVPLWGTYNPRFSADDVTVASASVDLIIAADLDLPLRWTWRNPLYKQFEGFVLVRGTLGVQGQISLFESDEGSLLSAQVKGTGTVELQFKKEGMRYCGYNLHYDWSVDVLWGWFSYSESTDYPDDATTVPDDCTLGSGLLRPRPRTGTVQQQTILNRSVLTGTSAVYGPNALDANIGSDLSHDSTPVLARTVSGTLALWSHASGDPQIELGDTLRYAIFTGTAWTAPVALTDSVGFNRSLAMASTGGGALAVWLQAPSSGLSLSDALTRLVTATTQTDVAFAAWQPGAGWSQAMTMGLPLSEKTGLSIGSGSGDTLVAAWWERLDAGEITRTLRQSTWNGYTWTVPVVVAIGLMASPPQIASVAGTPKMLWSQFIEDTDTSATNHQTSRIFAADFISGAWQAPAQISVSLQAPGAAALARMARPEDNDKKLGGFTWEFDFTPPSCEAKDNKNPDHPAGPPSASTVLTPTTSKDPNDIAGPLGYGEDRWIAGGGRYDYSIRFENDPVFANAAAQRVVITQPLDGGLDLATFRLGDFGFGDRTFGMPADRSYYNARLGPYAIEVVTGTIRTTMVDVLAGIDVVKGEAFWIFQTVDAATGGPPSDPLMGFLPPDYLDGNGQGHVNYSIRPKAALTTGALIAAQAFILFDANDVLPTNVATNTIDADRPWSALAPLAPSSALTRALAWSAGDGAGPGLAKQTGNPGSGLRDVSIYVAENGGAYGLWQTFGPTTTSAIFTGTPGTTYGFYAVASDNVGLVETGKGASAETSSYIPVIKRAMLPVVRR